jgi:hypothetical protein
MIKTMEGVKMSTKITNKVYAFCITFIFLTTSTLIAKGPEPLTPAAEKLLAEYTKMLNTLKGEVKVAVPKIDNAKKSAFVESHGKIAKLPILPNPKQLKMAPVTHARGNPDYAEAQDQALLDAKPILKEIKSFLKEDKLDAKLAKIALLRHGAEQMARFASVSKENKSYVDLLLADDKLIVEVMELGGAYQGKYGQSIRNYKAIQKASDKANSDEGFYRLWALGSSLEHPDGNHVPEGKTVTESLVEFYLNYEEAFHNKELDPAFGTMPAWEYRFIFPFRAIEDVVWMRKMMRNYRPDHMQKEDYRWRYCRITKSDVPYTSNAGGAREHFRKKYSELNISHMQSFFLVGGICGPRAFSGRLATHAFGIPSRPAPQTGHAAMSHWTPDGWTVVFGAHWTFNRFRGQCGLDFELESRSRKILDQYKQVHRANWLGDAYGESRVEPMKFGVGGGFWKSLAFYKKMAIVEAEDLQEQELTGSEFAESNEAAVSPNSDWFPDDNTVKKESTVPQITLNEKDKAITVDQSGVISIPVGAANKTESTEKVRFMKSYDESFVQMHYGLGGKRPELLSYSINVPKAGKYKFKASIVSVTLEQSFLMRVNRRSMYDVEVPPSIGDWVETEDVVMDLKAGKNKFQFTCKMPNKGLSVKNFTLTPVN